MTLLGLLAGLGGEIIRFLAVLWLIGLLLAAVWILYKAAAKEDAKQSELELPTWTMADELKADEDLNRATREWQQSVELPMARPLSLVRSRADEIMHAIDSGTYRVPPEKAPAVMAGIFPDSPRWKPKAS